MNKCCETITEAVDKECYTCIDYFVDEYGKDILNTVDKYGDSFLHNIVTTTEDFKMMKFLVKKGINVNIQNKDAGATPLYYAIGNTKFTKFLIEHGADPNIGRGSFYPIFTAIDSPGSLKYLFGKVDLNIQDENGDTPLHIYIRGEPKKSVIRKFIENGADPTIKNNNFECAKDYYMEIFEK